MNTQQELTDTRYSVAADLLRMLSAGFSHPCSETVGTVVEIASGLIASQAVNSEMNTQLSKLIADADEESIRTDYSKIFLFGGMPTSESYCTGRFDCIADVSGFYAAFGVTPKQGEVPDSIMHELEFLALLCVKVLQAPSQEERDVATEALTAFVVDHLWDFVLKFEEKLSTYNPTDFYQSLLEIMRSTMTEYFYVSEPQE